VTVQDCPDSSPVPDNPASANEVTVRNKLPDTKAVFQLFDYFSPVDKRQATHDN